MLFNTNLEEIIFHRHQNILSDELIILSGYVGPKPIERLNELPINTTVIYGMYGDKGIQERLHSSLIYHQNNINNVNIWYSTIPIHSKCYIWKHNNIIQHALIGSANFSTNGLTTPYREILAETTHDTFYSLNEYILRVLNHSILCTDVILQNNRQQIQENVNIISNICNMTLLDRYGNVPSASGLNWGHGQGHVTPNDSYIAIRKEHLRNCPTLFPPKQEFPNLRQNGRLQRHNDIIEIIWDDGYVMEGLLEGNQNENGLIYPKQISSSPRKNIMGEYIRHRIGIPSGSFVTIDDLINYGRTDITVSLINEGIYSFDFSVI
jgi:hypothetical protein